MPLNNDYKLSYISYMCAPACYMRKNNSFRFSFLRLCNRRKQAKLSLSEGFYQKLFNFQKISLNSQRFMYPLVLLQWCTISQRFTFFVTKYLSNKLKINKKRKQEKNLSEGFDIKYLFIFFRIYIHRKNITYLLDIAFWL